MEQLHFYFIADQYYNDFPDAQLMGNHEPKNGKSHDRPCFLAFQDPLTKLYWMIPISSKVQKYKTIFDEKMAKRGKCDTIVFGNVLGQERAFLIQNMCPINNAYVGDEYLDSKKQPVRVEHSLEQELKTKATKVLTLQRKGINVIFPDVLFIEKALLKQDS